MEEITQMISNVGFPIVACCFMYINNQSLNKTIADLSATLKTIDIRLDKIESKGDK